ncbi:hypothetical protein OS493_025669 [Desmophyllum pertusum]|uniref:Fibronectin type-III domain-containing protein n=1 Tax=Desmophyllum pertusum TaxID=174260 RepID=A0A9W9ZYV5_9CNID|nr:hypothetical protein OS493_025669 [Desmophyllum pertusum]
MNFTRAEANFTKVIIIPPDVINHHVTGLMKYTRYVISLAAVNEIGLGVSSDDVIVWTEEDVPSRAPNVNISQIYYTSSTKIRVHWEPLPQRFAHGRLLGYRVEYRGWKQGT